MKLTFLEAKQPLTKTFTLEDGELKKVGHPRIIDYLSHEEEVEDLEQFKDALIRHAEQNHCLLKGNLTRPLHWESRRGTTDPNAATSWVCFDLDGFKEIPDPQAFMDLVGFGSVNFLAQFSASSGVVPDRGLSAHVFALLERPIAAPLLKQILIQQNLSIPKLRAALGLTRTNNALRWALDVSTCQNDKLIYIAPPILGKGVVDGFKGKRIQLMKRKDSFISFSTMPNAELNRKEQMKALNTLREAAGLEKRERETIKTYGTVEYMAKPDRATVTGTRRERGFVYLNLNGGDSWGYYHPETNPEFIYNFKGEPAYKTKELLPDYWSEVREAVNGPKEDENGNLYLAFRDFKTASYWNGTYNKGTRSLVVAQAKSEGQLHSFLKQHGQPVGDYTPDWSVVYDPNETFVVDAEGKRINVFKPSEFEARQKVPGKAVPAPIEDVLMHVLGGDRVAYSHFLNWLACAVQLKCQVGTAWVWHGIQGTGKGLMLNKVLRPMFGHSNVTSKRMQELDSQFNGFLERCQLLWIEEAEASAFRNASVMDQNFKNYIVEPYISVRHMHMLPYEVRNYLNIIFSSNKDDPVILDPHDRRFNIGAFQPAKLIITPAGVTAVENAAFPFYCWLMEQKIDTERARTPLINQAKTDMIGINRLAIDVVGDAINGGDYEFFVDQKPMGALESLPRFEQDKAQAYIALVDKMKDYKAITREELFLLANYVVGSVPISPVKFKQFLGHHRLALRTVRRGSDVFKGVEVKWKEAGKS